MVDKMLAASRACVGTPFMHQGRVPHVGLDCVGLIVVALRAAGVCVNDRTDYGLFPHGAMLEEALQRHATRMHEAPRAGDILLFTIKHQPQHVGLQTSATHFIHAYAPQKKVVENSLTALWQRRLHSVYRLLG